MIPGIVAGSALQGQWPAALDPTVMSIATKLVSWWDFDNALTDRYGVNNLSGTVTYSAGLIAQKAVKSTRATKTSAVNMPPMTGGGRITVGAWVWIKGTGGEDVEARTTTNQAYRLAVRNGNQAHWVVGDLTSSVTISSSVGAVGVNSWAFLVGTADSVTGDITLYVNGSPVATGTATDFKQPTVISFGREIGNVFNALDNDASFICDGLLTDAEVAYLYNSGAGRPGSDFPILPRNAWTWFCDPRGIRLSGGRILLGGVGSDDGTIRASWTADAGATWSTVNLALSDPTVDDHDNPAFLRRNDGHLLAFFCRHNGASYFLSTSDAADDPSAWTRVDLDSQLGGGPYTYANPFQLTGEAGAPIYNFYRSGSTPTWSTYFSKSLDGGTTWAAQTRLLDGASGSGRPYLKAAQNGNRRVDFAVTDGHPNAVATNSIRHFYMEGGSFFSSDGTPLGSPPFDTATDLTTVYDGTTIRAWVWDIAIGIDGLPVIVFATFPSTTDHRYNYAKWNGTSWDVNEICAAGTYLYSGEAYYSGGVSLDPNDPNTVYASRESGGFWSLYRYTTSDGGASFTEEAMPDFQNAIRPFVVRGTGLLAAIAGRYSSYTSFAMRTLLTDKTA